MLLALLFSTAFAAEPSLILPHQDPTLYTQTYSGDANGWASLDYCGVYKDKILKEALDQASLRATVACEPGHRASVVIEKTEIDCKDIPRHMTYSATVNFYCYF